MAVLYNPAPMTDAPSKKSTNTQPTGWAAYRREIQFLVVFAVVLGVSFTTLSLKPVNDHVIEPFTGLIAKASGISLNLLGQDVERQDTMIRNARFAVNIKNGCNGVEAMVILLAAIVAFPATWRARGIGLGLGIVVIQLVNLIRVVALFLTGAYLPKLFDSSHTVIWQTIVILSAVLLWMYWANRFAVPAQTSDA